MPSLWVDEIDYDQIGTDTASFIEIKGNGVVDLSHFVLALVNGVYSTIALTSAGTTWGEGCLLAMTVWSGRTGRALSGCS